MKFICKEHGEFEVDNDLIMYTSPSRAACPVCGVVVFGADRFQSFDFQRFNGKRLKLIRHDNPNSTSFYEFDKCAIFGTVMMTVSNKDSLKIYRPSDFSEISVVVAGEPVFALFQDDKEPDSFITRITKMFAKK